MRWIDKPDTKEIKAVEFSQNDSRLCTGLRLLDKKRKVIAETGGGYFGEGKTCKIELDEGEKIIGVKCR
jgi:hypothetical protein